MTSQPTGVMERRAAAAPEVLGLQILPRPNIDSLEDLRKHLEFQEPSARYPA